MNSGRSLIGSCRRHLATVERTYSEVFDGPGLEGGTPLTSAHLAAVRPEDWERTTLLMNPGVRLLKLRFPAHEYITATRHGENTGIPAPALTHLVIFRRDFTVRRSQVTSWEYAILAALQSGDSLGSAIGKGIDLDHTDPGISAAALRESFRSWTAASYFRGIAVSDAC